MSTSIPSTRYSRVPRQASCEMDDEAVILHLESGTYFGLNSVGARIWELLESPATAGELVERIVEEYEVPASTCEADVLQLLEELCEAGLVEADAASPS